MAALKIQHEELKDLKKIFIQLDSDKNGLLTEEELQNGFGDICTFELFVDHFNGTDDDNFMELFSKLDLDHDGLLDYNEFLQAAINH